MLGLGTQHFDLTSCETYGQRGMADLEQPNHDQVAASSSSQVVGLISMFKSHRREMMLAN